MCSVRKGRGFILSHLLTTSIIDHRDIDSIDKSMHIQDESNSNCLIDV